MTKKIFLLLLIAIFAFSVDFTMVKADEYGVQTYQKLDSSDKKCKAIFGDPNDDESVAHYLDQIFGILKWLAPLLCLALSVVEFVKAAASQDKEALNKATTKTIKRIVLALVMFFLPSLINFLFPLLGWYGTCGIGGE